MCENKNLANKTFNSIFVKFYRHKLFSIYSNERFMA